MRDKISKYYNFLDNKLLNLKEEELKSIKEHRLDDIDITRNNYKDLFEQGLELIRKERLPKALMLEILDQYSVRLEDLEGVDLSIENLENHNEITREKIKSLVLFGIQAVLIKENAQLISELKRSNEYYEELIGLITHEFKNMLTSIYGYNKILRRQLEKQGILETSELITTIEKLTNKLFNMTDSLLKMSLSDKNELLPKKSMINLNEDFLIPVEKELLPLIKKKRITLKNKIKPKNISIMADNDFLRVVFRNLIENALKYGYNNSVIIVEIKSDKKHLNVSVNNKGDGIPDQIRNEVFQKFRHADVGDTKSGTGIGLFNVKNIVEKHGGKIRFDSEKNKWTKFYFQIPLN
jgi:signal transduction histidine kinase